MIEVNGLNVATPGSNPSISSLKKNANHQLLEYPVLTTFGSPFVNSAGPPGMFRVVLGLDVLYGPGAIPPITIGSIYYRGVVAHPSSTLPNLVHQLGKGKNAHIWPRLNRNFEEHDTLSAPLITTAFSGSRQPAFDTGAYTFQRVADCSLLATTDLPLFYYVKDSEDFIEGAFLVGSCKAALARLLSAPYRVALTSGYPMRNSQIVQKGLIGALSSTDATIFEFPVSQVPYAGGVTPIWRMLFEVEISPGVDDFSGTLRLKAQVRGILTHPPDDVPRIRAAINANDYPNAHLWPSFLMATKDEIATIGMRDCSCPDTDSNCPYTLGFGGRRQSAFVSGFDVSTSCDYILNDKMVFLVENSVSQVLASDVIRACNALKNAVRGKNFIDLSQSDSYPQQNIYLASKGRNLIQTTANSYFFAFPVIAGAQWSPGMPTGDFFIIFELGFSGSPFISTSVVKTMQYRGVLANRHWTGKTLQWNLDPMVLCGHSLRLPEMIAVPMYQLPAAALRPPPRFQQRH
ncbi:hypothetical protein EDD86DRAFT_76009 [Gorgonomyces haynaldii]|nr:hypothetical protein EDD86DRAFT_76009 [Gorgonomyces haynaldii]